VASELSRARYCSRSCLSVGPSVLPYLWKQLTFDYVQLRVMKSTTSNSALTVVFWPIAERPAPVSVTASVKTDVFGLFFAGSLTPVLQYTRTEPERIFSIVCLAAVADASTLCLFIRRSRKYKRTTVRFYGECIRRQKLKAQRTVSVSSTQV